MNQTIYNPPKLTQTRPFVAPSLKQSPRAWYDRFQTVVTQLGFRPSVHDSALFLLHTSTGFVSLLLYVDDMIITGFDSSVISHVKQHLFRTFEMKDLGSFTVFSRY